MSFAFDLNPQVAEVKRREATANPYDPKENSPGFWEGTLYGTGMGIMRGGARAANAVAIAGGALPVAIDALDSWGSGEERHEASDWYFKNVVDETTANAVDYWTPDAREVGTAGNVLGGLAEMVLPLAAGGGNPKFLGTTMAATAALDRPVGLMRKGVDAKTAATVGGVEALTTLAGFELPAAFGRTLSKRLVTGGLSNLALGAVGSTAQYGALKAGGYDDQAKAYDPADPTARTVDLLTGLAFGGLAHVAAPKAPLAQRDAILTARNADSFQRAAIPGPPVSEATAVRGQQAMERTLGQLSRGEPVNVADTVGPADFILPTHAADAEASDFATSNGLYTAYRRALESGGRADARNRASSATGIDQFTNATWRRIVARAKPAWAEGLSDAELLDARTDPVKSGEMAAALDAENAAALQNADLPATPQNLYAAHHFGLNVGRKFARADDATPIEQILSAEQLAANPYLVGRTKGETIAAWDERAHRAGIAPDGGLVDADAAGQALRRRLVEDPDQLLREYAELEDSQGGVVLNTDTARELSPEYLADRTRSADVHEAASDTIKTLYERKLAAPTPVGMDPVVLFTAGGTGAGKTTGLQAMGDALARPEIVYDTNMNSLRSSLEKIDRALDSGREVRIAYVYRDPVDALTGGAIPRAQRQFERFGSGRTVPLVEHARTHAGVRSVMEEIDRRYQGDKRVKIIPIDNSRGKDQQAMVNLADLPRVEENGLYERLSSALEEARQAGLDERLYRGFADQAARDRGLEGDRGIHRGQHQTPAPDRAARDRGPESNRSTHQAGGRAAGAGSGRSNGSGSSAGERAEQSAPGEVTAQSPVGAVAQLADESPEMPVNVNPDGEPIYRTLSEALEDIGAERARAEAEARGYTAAANCHLRRGGDEA